METFYSLLGLEPDASRDDIKRVYRDMAMMYHPDRYYGRPDEERKAAAEFFKRVNAAKQVLLDDEKRAVYDQTLTPIPRASPYEEASAVVEEIPRPKPKYDPRPKPKYDPRPRSEADAQVDTAVAVVHEIPAEGIPDPAVHIDRAVHGLKTVMDETFVHLDELERYNDAFIREYRARYLDADGSARDLYQRRKALIFKLRRRTHRTQNLVLDVDAIPHMYIDGMAPSMGAPYGPSFNDPGGVTTGGASGPKGPTPDRSDPWSKELVKREGKCPFCKKEAEPKQSYCYYCGGVF